jgi:predicted DNA binding CopG/RHH family protein
MPGRNSMSKKKMNFVKKDVLRSDELNMEKAKLRITTMIDMKIYDLLKKEAETLGIGYQTLINNILRRHTGLESENPIEAIFEEIQKLSKRVSKIEKRKTA